MTHLAYINGRFLTQRMTGVQRYALETLRELDELLCASALKGSVELTVLAPPSAEAPPLRAIGFRKVGTLSGNAWEQLELPIAAADALLLSFGPTGPILKRHQIVTIHDAAVHVVPEAYGWKFRAWYKLLLPLLARRGPTVMTVSHFARGELVEHFGADPSRVRVTGEGVEHATRVTAAPDILEKHGLRGRRYVLAVSSPARHKNFAVVAEAARLLRSHDVQIVAAGAIDASVFGSADQDALRAFKHVGYVSDGELRALYEHALAFVFPSVYEGFGIPPLEAMALGCPVIAAHAAAIPEVCGDAAMYFSPHDPEQLARLIDRIAHDRALREKLIARGHRQTQQHSWKRSAHAHLDVLVEHARREVTGHSRLQRV